MNLQLTNDEIGVFARFAARFHLDLDLAEDGVRAVADGFVLGRDAELHLLISALRKALEHCVEPGDLTPLFVDACAEQLPEENELRAELRAWLISRDAQRTST